MEFIAQAPPTRPKSLYHATAVITLTSPDAPQQGLSRRLSRRLSQGSQGDSADEGGLKRIISGSGQRRLSQFGREGRPDSPTAGGAVHNEDDLKTGKFFWRVKVGVTDTHLVLLPDSPNSTISTKPPTLTTDNHTIITPATVHDTTTEGTAAHQDEGITGKIKNMFRRSSVAPNAVSHDEASAAEHAHKVEAPASWPAVIKGQPLQAITVSLGSIETGKNLQLGTGGKKGEGSWVGINVTSHFASLVHPMLESVGTKHSHSDWARSGSIRFEFDKEWIGAKAEAEILHHQITMAIQNRPAIGAAEHQPHQAFADPFAKPDTLQLGGAGAGRHPQTDVAPESASTNESVELGKVAGDPR